MWRCCGSSPANVHEHTDVSRERTRPRRGCYWLSLVPGKPRAVRPSPRICSTSSLRGTLHVQSSEGMCVSGKEEKEMNPVL